MKILLVSPEIVPFAKTGGLADVSGAIPKYLAELGQEIAVIMPMYHHVKDWVRESKSSVKDTGIRVEVPVFHRRQTAAIFEGSVPGTSGPAYFIEHDGYFFRPELYGDSRGAYEDNSERFAFFSRAVVESVPRLGLKFDIFHVNDWQSALIPAYLRTIYSSDPVVGQAATVLTIHNLAYQGVFNQWDMNFTGLPWKLFNWKQLEFYGKVNYLKGGIAFADLVTTVSQQYAKEIQTPEYGSGLEGVLASRSADLFGVLNGVDYEDWDPATDMLIPANYTPGDLSGKKKCKAHLQKKSAFPVRDDVLLVGMVSRLADQKGFDILADAVNTLMEMDIQVVILGTGEQRYHELLTSLGKKFPQKIALSIKFDNQLAHEIEAGADAFLMPSRYEPCGLNQMYSLKYGTVPIVRATGGLADTITDCSPNTLKNHSANGFSFTKYSADALLDAIKRAVKVFTREKTNWKKLMTTGMKQDWSWKRSAKEYIKLYKKALEKRSQPADVVTV
jgi:starch synthase